MAGEGGQITRIMRANTTLPPKPLALAAIVLAMAAFHACSTRKAASAAVAPTQEEVEIRVTEPLETSELALMMRQMTLFTDSTRTRLMKGGELLPYPGFFKGLKNAEPTPGMVEQATFDPYADAWLYHLDALYAAKPAERAEVFNTLVQTCAACHGHMCPGPLVRIKKLKLPEE